jgi:single-stranded-DNA-specific exonuclease
LAEGLDALNVQRRKIEADTFKQACKKLDVQDEHTPLVIYDEAWHAGVVGLVAGRLARQHGRPAAVGFIEGSGAIRVSLRGVKGFHIGNLLQACSNMLTGFGGHAGAGGGTVKEGMWQDFVVKFHDAVVQQQQTPIETSVLIDGVLSLSAMHMGLASRLQKFEPIGQGNPAPLWLLHDVTLVNKKSLKGGVCRLQLSDGALFLSAVLFKSGVLLDDVHDGQCLSLLGQLKPDDYRGGNAVQFVAEVVLLDH